MRRDFRSDIIPSRQAREARQSACRTQPYSDSLRGGGNGGWPGPRVETLAAGTKMASRADCDPDPGFVGFSLGAAAAGAPPSPNMVTPWPELFSAFRILRWGG